MHKSYKHQAVELAGDHPGGWIPEVDNMIKGIILPKWAFYRGSLDISLRYLGFQDIS